MNNWDFTFEAASWEKALDAVPSGGSLSALRFLTMMEPEPEAVVEDALAELDRRDILLNISELPAPSGSGEAAVRLRREAQLVHEKKLPQGLEENDPLRLYLEELASIPVCRDTGPLARECLSGSESAAARLASGMLNRVVDQAFSLAGQGVLLLDLIQEGSLGLWQAVLNYSGGDFEIYAERQIRRTMAKTVTLQARANGVGQRMRQALEDYRTVDERLLTELGRNPTLEEIAEQLHMTAEQASVVADTLEAARMVNRARSESEPRHEEPEDDQAVENTAYFQMRQRIGELLSGLDAADAQLLTLRFGLEGDLPLSPEDTGKKLGLTPEEVVAREAAALAMLRNQ